MKFWDPEDHVFRLNTTELCSTIKEFSAILGHDPRRKSVVVSYDPRHKESLSDALGLPTSITNSMIEGHMVNLHAIISRLINKCKKTSVWLYSWWENFCFVLEDAALWMPEP